MRLLSNLIDLYSIVVLAAVVLSWTGIPLHNPAARFVNSLTEPLLGPIRTALPVVGGLDFSPMVLLIALQFLKRLIAGRL